MPSQNYVISFQPTQLFFIGGTSVVVSGSTCGTDVSGSVVGVRNPLAGPIVSAQYSGSLPAGNYYSAITWYDTYGHQTLPSPPTAAQLTSSGSLQISPPSAGAPANAIGMDVYIGARASAMTYQGQTTSTTATYTQSAALSAGAAMPISNTTVCQVVANDAGWPTGTGYNVTLSDATGNVMPGYPQQLQFLSPGSTYNLSNGIPAYDGRVTYPVPLLTQPYNHNMQSINGPLSMGTPGGIGYNIVNVNELGIGTSLPAWGVDVEGSGLASVINAKGGYLINGSGGTSGQCLASDGNYFDTPVSCLTSLPTVYYQSINANGTAQTQRPALNFSTDFTVSDSTSPAQTTVGLANSGATAGSYTNPNVTVDGKGRVTSIASGTPPGGYDEYWNVAGCAFSADTNGQSCSQSMTIPNGGFADTNYWVTCQPYLSTAASASFGYVMMKAGTKTPTGFTLLLIEDWGNNAGAGNSWPEVDCHAHHN